MATTSKSLKERGIEQTALAAGWQPYTMHGRPGWRYPVQFADGTAYRWKAGDKQKPKYCWLGGQPKACKYYIPQNINALRSAIEAADGVLYIANGEPSVLAYLAAGVQNVLSWFGEGQPPHTLSEALRAWGVRDVRYPVDKDDAGRKSALAVRSRLKDSGIAFHPLQWGEAVAEKGDANDLWQAVGSDALQFVETLDQLNALLLPTEEIVTPAPSRQYSGVPSLKRADAIAAVIERAEAQGRTKVRGDFLNFCCLLHEEDEPSAGINTKTGTYTCFVCGSFKLLEVCERLGIDYTPYQPADHTNSERSNGRQTRQQEVSAVEQYHKNGVPDSWRSTLLRQDANAAVVYELLTTAITARHVEADNITHAALMRASLALGWGCSRDLLYRGMEWLAKQLIAELRTDQHLSVGNSAINSIAGRHAGTYQLRTLGEQRKALLTTATPAIIQRRYPVEATPERAAVAAPLSVRALAEGLEIDEDCAVDAATDLELIAEAIRTSQPREQEKAQKGVRRDFDRLASWLMDATSAPLPEGWRLGSVKDYRTAVVRAWKLHDPDADWLNGDKKTAQALGITAKTVSAYLERAGVDVEHNQRVEHRITSPKQIEREVTRVAFEVKGRPLHFKAKVGNSDVHYDYSREAAARVADLVVAGVEVYTVYQVANKHTAIADALPPVPAPRQVAAANPRPISDEGIEQPQPEEPRKRAAGYSPEWVRGQLALYLRLLGWQQGERYVNPDNGEMACLSADGRQLASLLLGREVGGMFQIAEQLGAVITRIGG